MAKVLSTGSEWIWINNVNPGISETNVSQGNLWLNTNSNDVFICKDATNGAQIWDKYPVSPITVANGGTGLVTLTANAIYVGNSTSSPTAISVGETGTVLIGNTGADPTFSNSPSVTKIAIGTPTITSGAGAPSAHEPKGSLYLNTSGSGVNDRAYIATDSSGTWTSIVTVA